MEKYRTCKSCDIPTLVSCSQCGKACCLSCLSVLDPIEGVRLCGKCCTSPIKVTHDEMFDETTVRVTYDSRSNLAEIKLTGLYSDDVLSELFTKEELSKLIINLTTTHSLMQDRI